MSILPLFFKTHVKAKTRKLASGKVITVRAYDDKRKKHDAFNAQLDLFLDLDPALSGQPGPQAQAAKQSAVAAVKSLRRDAGNVLATRLADSYASRHSTPLVGHTITEQRDLAVLAQVYRDPRFETFRLFFTDADGKIVSQVGLSSRLPASSSVFIGPPDEYMRELAANAKQAGATGFWMLHNHPSTNVTPSDDDIKITVRMWQSMKDDLDCHGHVIIDHNQYCNITRYGGHDISVIDDRQGIADPLANNQYLQKHISQPEDVAAVAKKLELDRESPTLIVVDAKHKVLGVAQIPTSVIQGKASLLRLHVLKAIKSMNGAKAFAVGNDMDSLHALKPFVMDALRVDANLHNGYYSIRSNSLFWGSGDPFSDFRESRSVPRVTADTSPEFDYLRDQSLALRLARNSAIPLQKAESTERHPTAAQIKAGNYAKRKIPWRGMTISVENEAGSVRSGVDPGGKPWRIKMKFAYGYLNRTEGVDGDHVDVYLGPDLDTATNVYVVHQRKVNDWKAYDEDKAMLGFPSRRAAVKAFLANYTDKRFLGPVTVMPVEQFIEKAKATLDRPKMIKTFSGHLGRPGLVGGSVKRSSVDDGAGSAIAPLYRVESKPDATMSREDAKRRVLQSHNGGKKPVVMDGVSYYISTKALNKMTAEHGEGGKEKPYQRQRIIAIQSLDELAAAASVVYREDEKNDPDVDLIAEGRAIFRFDGLDYQVRLLGKIWRKGAQRKDKLHSMAIEDVLIEKFDADQLSLRADGNLHKNWGIDRLGMSGTRLSASVAFEERIQRIREESRGLFKSITLLFPNGHEYRVDQGHYRWQVSALMLKALGPGERWITIHPGGNKDAKGVPVLVRETHGGSGVFHVIGGAGGKLNYMKMRGLKPESDYKTQARERAANKREIRKEQAKQERESGQAGIKNAQREAVQQQARQERQRIIDRAAELLKWKPSDYQFKPEEHKNLSPVALRKAAERHDRDVLNRVNEAMEMQRERLVVDPDLRKAAGLDRLPVDSPAAVSVTDIDPVAPVGNTLGFAPKYEERAQAQGAAPEAIKQEAQTVKDDRLTPDEREAAIKRGETRDMVKRELENIRAPILPEVKADVLDAQAAAELMSLKKQLQIVNKRARDARADIDKDTSGKIKAYNITVGDEPDLDEAVKADLENDIRTVQTRAFLSAIKATAGKDYEQTLNAAMGAGAFNSVNALAITAGGAALVDRSVVDVLGPAGAAQVLARRLHTDLDADTVERITEGLEDFHVNHYLAASKAALDHAASLQAEADKLKVDSASDAEDLAVAKALVEKRMKAINEAQTLLGTTLGEMETNAALVVALKAGRTATPLEVPLGGISPEDAIRQCRAIGLQRGDYRLDKVDGNEILTVTPEGLDRLAKPVDVEDLHRAQRNLDIIEGRQDEDNWLPKGVANRPDLAMPPANPGVASVLAKPFEPGDDLAQSLRDYIGGRMADGDSVSDILADIQSKPFFDKAGEDRYQDYLDALNVVAPLKDANGKNRPIESQRPAFEAMADEFVARHYGADRKPLHRQTFDPNDEKAAESLYRALAEVPEGIAAFKPIGELTHDDRKALRGYFQGNIAKTDVTAEELRQNIAELTAKEPNKYIPTTTEEWKAWHKEGERLQSAARWGGEEEKAALAAHADKNPGDPLMDEVNGVSPLHKEWKEKLQELNKQLNAVHLDWAGYTDRMGGAENAYATMQDLIRSKVSDKFSTHYNTVHAAKPLKRGSVPVRNSLAHAEIIDPELRAQRYEEQQKLTNEMRELLRQSNGQWGKGSYKDRVEAERQAMKAAAEAQFEMWGDEIPEDVPEEQQKGKPETPFKADERYTLGHAAENQISRMVPMMARNFKPGQPFKMWQPSMNGKGVARQRAIKLVEANKRFALGLGTGCVYGGTLLACAQTGMEMSFYDWWLSGIEPHVISKNTFGKTEAIKASPVFVKGVAEMFMVELASGASIVVTGDHQFMSRGDWVKLKHLSVGDVVETHNGMLRRNIWVSSLDCHTEHALRASPDEALSFFVGAHRSTSDASLQFRPLSSEVHHQSTEVCDLLVHDEDAVRSCQKAQGSQSRYWPYCHPYDEQPRQKLMDDQGTETLQADAHEYTLTGLHLGAQKPSQECNRSYQQCDLHSRNSFSASDCRALDGGFHIQSDVDAQSQPTHSILLRPERCSIADEGKETQADLLEYPCEQSGLVICGEDGQCQTHQGSKLLISEKDETCLQQTVDFSFSCSNQLSDCELLHDWGSSEITNITNVGDQIIFDIKVPRNNCYVANGILNHNSGKTLIQLGSFSHLHQTGQAKRGLFLVPSIVQSEFRAEAARYLDPKANGGKGFNYHIEPGASRDERIAAYKNPDHHFAVMTHSAFRDDMLHLGAKQAGIETAEMRDRLAAMKPAERKAWIQGVMDKEGIKFDFLAVDEFQGALNRLGKEDSSYANVLGALSQTTPYFVPASADLVKNDLSEAHSLLSYLDPDRYSDRGEFMRRYGADTEGSRRALKQELNRYVYAHKIDPEGVQALKQTVNVDLNDKQHAAIRQLKQHLASARLARMSGTVDVGAVKALMPSRFEGVPESEHAAVAKDLQQNLGLVKESAMGRIIDDTGVSAKYDRAIEIAGQRKGTPGIIFAHRIESVHELAKKLEAEGHAVTVLTGKDSPDEKARKVREYRQKGGVLVASDAASTGMNAQNAKWVVQYDTPQTALTHHQRGARAFRTGQTDDVELIDLVANHEHEHKARDRLKRKYALRELMTSPLEAADDTGLAYYLKQRDSAQEELF